MPKCWRADIKAQRIFLRPGLIFGLLLMAPGLLSAQKNADPKCSEVDTSPVIVPLDGTGVSDWRFLNPRRPYPLVRERYANPVGPAGNGQFRECLGMVKLRFDNQTSALTFNVKIPIERPKDDRAEQLEVSCPGDPDEPCVRTVNIGPRNYEDLTGSELDSLPDGPIVVEVSFSESADIPANTRGYLQAGLKPGSVSKDTKWTVSGVARYQREPLVPGKDDDGNQVLLALAEPHQRDEKRRLFGSASLKLDQKIGTRAAADVTFRFKNGDLGEKDSSGATAVPSYRFRFFGDNGAIVNFGKTDFIDSLGANESGEGFEISYKALSGGMIVKRESATGAADDADQDWDSFFIRLQGLSFGSLGPWTRFNLLAVYGEDDKPESARTFWTAGGEFFFTVARPISIHGDLAIFHGERKTEGPATTVVDGKGTSALLSLTWSKLAKQRRQEIKAGSTLISINLDLGYGEGDDPATPEQDEGYLGDSASFKPDRIFLRSFAGKIGADGDTVAVAGGLSNKSYAGVTLNLKSWSLLEWVSRLWSLEDEPTSRSSSITVHRYRFVEPVFGEHDAGHEIDIDFTLQLPKGVTTQLGFSYFLAGDALEEIINEDPWGWNFGVSVTL